MPGRPNVINGTLLVMVAVLVGLIGFAHHQGGSELVGKGLGDGWGLLIRFAPVIAISFLAAGFAETLIPHEWVRGTLGDASGVRGILIAAGAAPDRWWRASRGGRSSPCTASWRGRCRSWDSSSRRIATRCVWRCPCWRVWRRGRSRGRLDVLGSDLLHHLSERPAALI